MDICIHERPAVTEVTGEIMSGTKAFPGTSLSAHLTPASRRKSTGPAGSPVRENGPASATPRGPSLLGVLASKRMARKFANRFAERRKLMDAGKPKRAMEPTYRMEPTRKFESHKVETIMKDVIDKRLEGHKYSARLSSMLTKILTEEVKEKIKELNYDRYKIICIVTIGENKNQGLRISSRCTWDTNSDTVCTYNYQNTTMFCTATVYGVYCE